MMTYDEIIAVLQADKGGKLIEFSEKGSNKWVLCPWRDYNFDRYDYRVKPEPHKEENPLIQNLLEYFKNTTKEQRQKDWDEIKSLYPDENEDWSEVFGESIPTAENKPEPHYRPFNSAEEVMEAVKERGDWVDTALYKCKFNYVTDYGVGIKNVNECTFKSAFNSWTFLDGTPFGIKE